MGKTTHVSVKSQMLEMIERLPDNATHVDIMEAITLRTKIDDARDSIKKGDYITHEKARKQFSKWLRK